MSPFHREGKREVSFHSQTFVAPGHFSLKCEITLLPMFESPEVRNKSYWCRPEVTPWVLKYILLNVLNPLPLRSPKCIYRRILPQDIDQYKTKVLNRVVFMIKKKF